MCGGKGKPARGAKIEFRCTAQFTEHGGERAGAQRLLHRLEHFAGIDGEHKKNAGGIQPEGGKSRSVGRAILERREFVTHPERRLFPESQCAREECRGKTGGCSRIAFGGGRHFMECTPEKTAAEHTVEFREFKRKRRRVPPSAAGGQPLQ